MTPTAEERAEAAAIDVEGRQARIAEILQRGTGDPSAENQAQARPARAKRKDAGHPRPKKAEPAAQLAGCLSQEQVTRLCDLIAEKETCQIEWTSADRHAYERKAAYEDARSKLRDFIREITIK